MKLEGKKILFLGDSITEGVDASKYKNCYVERVKQLAKLGEAVNYGISGTRFAKQNIPSETATFDLDFVTRASQMEENADAVVVFGGTNDFGHGDAPFGQISDTSYNTFCGACDELFGKLIEKYPDIPIIVLTPLHRLGENDTVNEIGLKRKTLSEYADVIRVKAQKYSIPVLDLFAKSNMQPNVEAQNSIYFTDGLHPNDNGHNRIAKLLISFLENTVD